MTLFGKIKVGLHSIYQTSGPQKLARDHGDVDLANHFRGLLLGVVATESGEGAARLARRIRGAPSIESLWFMRSEVMALLAPIHGEAEAMHRLEAVSASVRESLPRGLRSRPSPLAREA